MNNERKSEKRGWILGWSGGFVWVVLLAAASLAKGDMVQALMGSALVGAAIIAILVFAPWRHPRHPYWLLMSPIYLLFFLSVGWLVWLSGGIAQLGLSGWSYFLLLPLLLPFYLVGKRRWIDGEHKDP
jgi:hypothetical protein